MRQVFKLYYDFNKTQLKIIEELSYHTTKLAMYTTTRLATNSYHKSF